jgi:polysaccharide export outer membrane protein
LLIFCFFLRFTQDVVYYQGIDGIAAQENSDSYEIKIQPDLLMIIVSAEDRKFQCLQFKINFCAKSGQWMRLLDSKACNYGGRFWVHRISCFRQVKVGGLSRSEVLQMLQQKMVYIKTNY